MKLLVLFVVCMVYGATADLGLSGTKCGVITCKNHEYCSSFDNKCQSCANICNRATHNFDERICIRDCQDYLHDVRYLRSGNNSQPGVDLTGDIQKLFKLVSIALTLVILVILALLAYTVYKLYFWIKDNDITVKTLRSHFTKKPEDDENKTPNNGAHANGKRDFRLEIPPSGNQSELSPATMTTSISRRPAEDSALDYAYDNRAMSGTPSPPGAKTARESNF